MAVDLKIRPAKLVNPARETLLFISLFNHCMWQHETCLNLITFCVIKKGFQTNCKWSKIRLRLHQRASIFYNPRASRALMRALDPGRKGLRASRSWCALLIPPPPLPKQFWPFQVALESRPALLIKSLRTPAIWHIPPCYICTPKWRKTYKT